ncbi:uncharacterized protein M6B38_224830 [Iris pallida]|uniref:Remorin C-terminal domain-containing protein n=1 Tax=Iris pallida TaxID=29817 RepID=A0AAX6DUF8_IRIPA|nr:uncharacterized protein M6B38_224830 [Iris pallida]
MKKSSAASAANLPGLGTPNYPQKGWSSERVPPPAAAAAASVRRYVLPFNNGKALPSKWEDAEKWIFSPADNNAGRHSVPHSHLHHHHHHHRRPKSKSGPLAPPAYLLSSAAASPSNPCFESGRARGFNAGSSPFLAGILAADRSSCGSASSGVGVGGGGGGGDGGGGGGRSSSAHAEPYILRSASIHGWLDTMIGSSSSLPSSRDEKIDSTQEAGVLISPTVLRKDVATQMSPDGSPRSSPKERPSPSQPLAHPIEELESHFSKLEVRDVQVDDRVTVTRWSKKHIARNRRSTSIIEWKKKTVEAKDSSSRWEVAETAKSISKYKREEAKITAWENLQKAKAEAAIRKLEMKLEKKRFSSMEKILNKLRSAQSKAKERRSAVTANQAEQVVGVTKKAKTGQISALSGCFMCHAS